MGSLIGAIGSSTSHGTSRGALSLGKNENKKAGSGQVAYLPSIGQLLGSPSGHSSNGTQHSQTAFNA